MEEIKLITLIFASTDCESLIRKMLVLDPLRRYTIEQIKRHRWMTIEVMEPIEVESSSGGTSSVEPNEQILKLMTTLGIDAQKTRESLKVSLYFITSIKCLYPSHMHIKTNLDPAEPTSTHIYQALAILFRP